jgi:hypothetical protein
MKAQRTQLETICAMYTDLKGLDHETELKYFDKNVYFC